MRKNTPPVKFSGRSITIACTNQKRSEHFYADILGAELIHGDGYGSCWYQLGSFTISIIANAKYKSPTQFPDHAMPVLWLEVDNIRLAHEYLKNSGVSIIQAPDEDMSMLVADPDHLVIEIWQK